MLQSYFKIAHFAGSVNTTAEFLSRIKLKVTKKVHLKIREDIQTTPIEVTVTSSDVSDEKHIFSEADKEKKSEAGTLQQQEQSRQDPKEGVAKEEPSSSKTSVKEFTKVAGNIRRIP